ncbi:hypothetical protein BY996DRAFT_125535 [Phakopsora pachyrhizi]|nr:hypothetical protein BY996DRAFT_125535 [Phakopsora pachyrhizi]
MATHQGNMMGSSPLWALGKSRESIILVVMRFIKMRGAHTFSRDDIYHIEKRRYPPVAQSTYVILLVLGVLHLLVMWACFLVIVLPLKSQECKRRKYLWAFKRVYSGHISKSFIVPNSALAVGTTQFVSSTLCLISVALQYLSFASPQAASRVSLNAVVQIMWLFNFYGYWITGWAALCTVLCSAQSQIPNFIKPLSLMPKAVNTLCLTFPALVTIFSIGEAIIIFLGHIEESRAYNGTRDVMLQLVNAQENNQSLIPFAGLL